MASLNKLGLIGTGKIGRPYVHHLSDLGVDVQSYDVQAASLRDWLVNDRPAGSGVVEMSESLADLLAVLPAPRVVQLFVPHQEVAGTIDQLIVAGLQPEDIVIDSGNSPAHASIANAAKYAHACRFFCLPISGGKQGARNGPCLMASGEREVWEVLRPLFEQVAAQVDGRSGGEPCVTYLGTDGAAHFVKAVHNGIEYAVMQLIGETAAILRHVLKLSARRIAEIFAAWNKGPLESYLLGAAVEVLRCPDPRDPSRPLIEAVLDAAEQQGTGRCTALEILELGDIGSVIIEAVTARSLSALKGERSRAAQLYNALRAPACSVSPDLIDQLEGALFCSMLVAYSQGFRLLQAKAKTRLGWDYDRAAIAGIWRGGCVIRARVLEEFRSVLGAPEIADPLLSAQIAQLLIPRYEQWVQALAAVAGQGVHAPALMSALSCFEGLRSDRLFSAALVALLRDHFGGHGFERLDEPGRWTVAWFMRELEMQQC